MRMDEILDQEQLDEDRLDEVLPLITGAAALAGGVMRGAGAAAKGIGKGVGAVAKGVGKTIGTIASAPAKMIGSNDEKQQQRMLKPGAKVPLPTQDGKIKPFKVTRITGNEVEIENPDGQKSPNQPNKIIYNKDDLMKSIPT